LVELLLPGASKSAGRLPQGSMIQAGAVAALFLLLVGLPTTARAASDEALERYRKGEFAASRQEYERLAQEKPDDFRLRFNAGTAAYRMDDFAGAAGLFEQVLRSPDLELQQQGWYNLGNSRYRAGEAEQDPDKKREQWQQALSSYTAALKLNPGDPSAQANYQAVKRAIETMPPPPPQQGGGKKNDPSKDSKQDKQDQKQDSKDGSNSDSQDSQSGQKDGQKNGKDSKKNANSPPGDPSKQQQPSQDKNQDSGAEQGKKPDPQEGAQSQGQSGEQAGKKPGESRQGKPSAAGAKPGEASGDQRGEAGPGAEAGEPDKDARQGELMTIREAEKVLDGQKGSEKALIFRRRGSGEMGEGTGKSARRKAW
jgi:Ca-activated chloride channel family protein